MKELQKDFKDINLTLMGLAFRGDVKEYRNSPTLAVVDHLKEKVENLRCFDPLFSTDEIYEILGIKGVDSLEKAFQDSDCLIFLTNHTLFKTMDLKKYSTLMRENGLIIDGRQIFDPKDIINLKLHYKGIGRVI